jgi:tRNA synthetases class I (E and Q), anti-codon binding domain
LLSLPSVSVKRFFRKLEQLIQYRLCKVCKRTQIIYDLISNEPLIVWLPSPFLNIIQGATRPKGTLSWVPVENAVSAEVRLYNHLFTVPTPATDDTWEKQVNPESEVIHR